MYINQRQKLVTTKTHATIHNVRGGELPVAWAKMLGLNIETDTNLLINVTLDLAEDIEQKQEATANTAQKKRFNKDHINQLVKKLNARPDINSNFSQDDLYDENGLPA